MNVIGINVEFPTIYSAVQFSFCLKDTVMTIQFSGTDSSDFTRCHRWNHRRRRNKEIQKNNDFVMFFCVWTPSTIRLLILMTVDFNWRGTLLLDIRKKPSELKACHLLTTDAVTSQLAVLASTSIGSTGKHYALKVFINAWLKNYNRFFKLVIH